MNNIQWEKLYGRYFYILHIISRYSSLSNAETITSEMLTISRKTVEKNFFFSDLRFVEILCRLLVILYYIFSKIRLKFRDSAVFCYKRFMMFHKCLFRNLHNEMMKAYCLVRQGFVLFHCTIRMTRVMNDILWGFYAAPLVCVSLISAECSFSYLKQNFKVLRMLSNIDIPSTCALNVM